MTAYLITNPSSSIYNLGTFFPFPQMNYTIAFLIQHPVCWCDPFIGVCTPFSIGCAPIQEFVYPPRRYAHTPQTVSLHTILSNCKTTFSPLLFLYIFHVDCKLYMSIAFLALNTLLPPHSSHSQNILHIGDKYWQQGFQRVWKPLRLGGNGAVPVLKSTPPNSSRLHDVRRTNL